MAILEGTDTWRSPVPNSPVQWVSWSQKSGDSTECDVGCRREDSVAPQTDLLALTPLSLGTSWLRVTPIQEGHVQQEGCPLPLLDLG